MRKLTDDIRIAALHTLIAPVVLMEELSLGEAESELVADTRRRIGKILSGLDDRLLIVAGPCSIHDPGAALEYGGRLRSAMERHSGELELVMRVYFEKPRTTVGWKGLINDPGLDESYDINRGLHVARRLLLDLARMGVPAGTEFLDTITPQYIADAVVWGAIGARTTESQVHRELASGLSMPVGFKNGTDGNIKIAVDAIVAARHEHYFLSVTKQGVSAIVKTRGNDCCHIILRGGASATNYDADSIATASATLRNAGLAPYLMVDCSHGNSAKKHANQPLVARELARQIAGGGREVAGVMIESHLVEGRQDHTPGVDLTYGQSITDACISWETTNQVLDELAEAVRARRAAKADAQNTASADAAVIALASS